MKALKKKLVEETQKRHEFEDWFEEKVAVEFKIERELARQRTLQAELDSNQGAFEAEIQKLNDLIAKRNEELQIK